MEPSDPAKNEGGSGYRRRLSSILKAPRKSIRVPDQEQQENKVECAKPVEKRNSRRVSFAPANDVLLFSKDVKNVSPAQSPLQALMAATADPQNRVQFAITEDGIQQITGMDTLLNAPLHASQQNDKVTLDSGMEFGERTVMFSTEDAFMDMTHCHTINIARDEELADISLQNYHILPTGGEKTVIFSADDGSMDMTMNQSVNMPSGTASLPTSRSMDSRAEKENKSSSVSPLDADFGNFLASLSKPGRPSVNPIVTRKTSTVGVSSGQPNNSLALSRTQQADVDKENQPPSSVSVVMEKTLNMPSALYPEDDVSMDMTEAQTGRIQAFDDDDDDDDDDGPFKCLFPSQEMYSQLGNKFSQTSGKTKQQQSRKTMPALNSKDMTSMKNPPPRVSLPGQQFNFEQKEEHREKTIVFSASEDFMDMTKSHTVNISSGSFLPPSKNLGILQSGRIIDNTASEQGRKVENRSAKDVDEGFKNFLASLTKSSARSAKPVSTGVVPPPAASKSFGETFKGEAIRPDKDTSMEGLPGSDDPFQFLVPTKDMYQNSDSLQSAKMTSGQKNSKVQESSNCAGFETSLKPSLKSKVQRNEVEYDFEEDCREKTVRFSADDSAMDVTRSYTVNIATDVVKKLHQNVESLPACGEKTVRFNANDAAMDVTRSYTVNIATSLDAQQKEDFLSACGDKTLRFTEKEAAMDVTQSHTVNIATNLDQEVLQGVDLLPSCEDKTLRFDGNDAAMDVTQCHTVNISGSFLPSSTDEDILQSGRKMDNVASQQRRKTENLSAKDVDEGFKNFLASLTKSSAPSAKPVSTGVVPPPAASKSFGETFKGEAIHPDKDTNMEGLPGSDDPFQFLVPTKDMYQNSDSLQSAKMTSGQKNNKVQEPSNRAGFETSLKPSLKSKVQRNEVEYDFEEDCREKTVRFSADDAAMDVTRSYTVNIATDVVKQLHQNLDSLPACGEKTVRFSADDAAMDVTRSYTVNIATDVVKEPHQNVDFLPACGEKTVRFSADDAAMDVTRSYTVNIATDVKEPHQNVDSLPACAEKTVRFSADDAAMDVTRSYTVNIATDVVKEPHQNVDSLLPCGEKTVRFSADDAAMDETRSCTVNIATNDAAMDETQCLAVNITRSSAPDSVIPNQDSNSITTQKDDVFHGMSREIEQYHPHRNRSLPANSLDSGLKISQPRTSRSWGNSRLTKGDPQETEDPDAFLDDPKTQKNDVNGGKAANENMTAADVSMDMNEAQTGQILNPVSGDESPQVCSSTQEMDLDSDQSKKTEMSLQNNKVPEASCTDDVKTANRTDSLDSNESEIWKEPEPKNQTFSLAQKTESSPAAIDDEAAVSRKFRRKSLADLQSKLRRLSHLLNTAPDAVPMESCTVTLPVLDQNMDKSPKDKTNSLPLVEPESELGFVTTEEDAHAQCLLQEGETSTATTTPFKLKTKQLMSRLSVGGFKAKLPQRTKPEDSKKVNSVGEHTKTMTVNVTHQLGNFDADVSDIYDEELGSCEDMSEMIDSRTPQKATENCSPSQKLSMDSPLEVDVPFFISPVCGNKRPLATDEKDMGEDEKRRKSSDEMAADIEEEFKSHVYVAVDSDGNMTTAPSMTTQSTDFSNSSHTASRHEATFESTFKQSLFESQLEGYANDVQRKLADGTITVLEFFKLFNIDFVIHNPRQSVLPGRLLSDTDRTRMDLLRDRHINRPRQTVYEKNILDLTEKVEGLKERMQDLDKPLRIVNRALWEETSNFSEKELKSFGAKLKERNNFFRKMSKVKSHEMKEVLYSQLVQANLEEQQKLRGRIEKADEMIKSLDDCIHELETEIAAVEEKGTDDSPSQQSIQKELQKVTMELADHERQTSELDMQKTQNSSKLKRVIAETKNLESHVDMLNVVNEWNLGGKTEDSTLYTFLHNTVHLELQYEKSNENDAENQPDRKISHIKVNLQLDDEKSQDHARLVHKLVSQYISEETSWVEKYPTSRHVPKLLHDVSLVVSRCRLLGEEVRLLKMWGSLRFDILNISCVDTNVHIVFSSLKKMSKFEVTFSVSLTNKLCVLQVQSFRNVFGSTTIEQIKEIVASISSTKKLLTKIVKKSHETLLC
ncbi:kinetochore scaffold 1 isoform X3 [Cheilinus undulatus]|uniref:kinetochore scaffold 1 isoform X3 n=1 Tax=Cheilinus undulatus TaxID=241271 RepID=UPI001BD53400|nr:kinetochore scaffold 1 isoform X3 [Cheilinus undulatus]